MQNHKLLLEVNRAFAHVEKPRLIYKQISCFVSDEQLMIQQDFGDLEREAMRVEQASMMIIDGPLISDETFCYFLPALAKFINEERINEFLFYRRLENINPDVLNQEQKNVVEKLIHALKSLENDLEREEQQHVEQAWIEWEKILLERHTIQDAFFLAISHGDEEEVKRLLKKGAAVNQQDHCGNTPLSIAKMRGQTKIMHLLLQQGAKESMR